MTACLRLRCGRRVAKLGAIVWLLAGTSSPVMATEASLAVAANFAEPARILTAAFSRATGHTLRVSVGSTGQFLAQISQGAPFDAFLAADVATPNKVIETGLGVPGTAFVYAVGRLVLFSRTIDVSDGASILRQGTFRKLAIALPASAPYGAAAIEVVQSLGLYEALKPKVVMGNSITQTLQFVETGNAELGFVALSQVIAINTGSTWLVPAGLHAPLAEAAVLLKAGASNEAARAFLIYLRTPEARAVIEKFGYSTDAP